MGERLKDKVAVVTGSGRGIGRAIALAFAEEEAKVVVNGTTPEKVDGVVAEIKESGGTAVANYNNVAIWQDAGKIIQAAIDNFGRIDILVNNAGILRDRTLIKMTEEEFDTVIATNLKGTFNCTRFAVPYMQEQKYGRIINSTSSAGLLGNFGQTNYAAAKAGIIGMTLCWALELDRFGITVNAIRGAARTRMTEPLVQRAQKVAQEANKPLPSPEEVGVYDPSVMGPLAVFLASEEADYINGQVFSLDGPRLALWSRPRRIQSIFMFPAWTTEVLFKHFKTTLGAELQPVGTDVVPGIIAAGKKPV